GMSCIMLTRSWKVIVIFGALWMQTFGSESTECIYSLDFPSLDGTTTVGVQEHSVIQLPFRLNTTCDLHENLTIDVSQSGPNDFPALICGIWQIDGSCEARDKTCSCTKEPGYYVFTRTARMSDKGASVSAIGASEAATDYEGYLVPVQAKKGADAGGLISPARVSSEDVSDSYERPVNPDYTTPNPVYQPLRHLYETVRQWRHSKRDSRSLDQDK
ncbi:hypothetical protein BaRGS_00031895, partial [Batillaria attramentaria]